MTVKIDAMFSNWHHFLTAIFQLDQSKLTKLNYAMLDRVDINNILVVVLIFMYKCFLKQY